MMNDRIVELETRVAFQEEHLDGLSQLVGRQQLVIDGLRRELEELRERLKVIASAALQRQEEESPPHY